MGEKRKRYSVELREIMENGDATRVVFADGFELTSSETLEFYLNNSSEDTRQYRTIVAAFASGCWRSVCEVV